MENLDDHNTSPASPEDDKTIAVLSYLGILWVVAYIMYGNKKSEYNLFHIRQGLGVMILWIATIIIGLFLPAFIDRLLTLGAVVLMIMGAIEAGKGTVKPLPVIGEFIQENLKMIK